MARLPSHLYLSRSTLGSLIAREPVRARQSLGHTSRCGATAKRLQLNVAFMTAESAPLQLPPAAERPDAQLQVKSIRTTSRLSFTLQCCCWAEQREATCVVGAWRPQATVMWRRETRWASIVRCKKAQQASQAAPIFQRLPLLRHNCSLVNSSHRF